MNHDHHIPGTCELTCRANRGEVTYIDTCNWLIEVPNGNPEPDFPSDCYDTIECGAPITYGDDGNSFSCDNGHHYDGIEVEWAPRGPQWQREQV